MTHVTKLVAIVAYLAATSVPVFARGFCRSGPVADEVHHEFQFFAGYSPGSTTLIGTAKDRRFVAAGFDYSYRCWAWQPVSISFTASAMPAAILLQPTENFFLPNLVIGAPNFVQVVAVRSHAVYGFAFTPIGFTADFGRTRPVFPFVQIEGGMIASTEPIPENVPNATSWNFLFDWGGGVKWRPGQGNYALSLGYKFLHISNAGRTTANPGVDNNVIYVGYSFLR